MHDLEKLFLGNKETYHSSVVRQEKIPGIIAQYEERTAKLKADVPQLEAIISKTRDKEDELKQLKSELAALDRKITPELAPKHDENDGEEVKSNIQQQQPGKVIEAPPSPQSQSTDNKKSMVAEPTTPYRSIDYPTRIAPRSIGL